MNDGGPQLQTWERRRAEVCLPENAIYLNSGSFSPLPKPVLAELSRLRAALAEQPSDFFWRQTPKRLLRSRRMLAEFFGTDAGQLLLLPNVTYAVNLVARSLDLPLGSEILITNQEYGAMQFCWQEVSQQRGWTVRVAEIPESPESPDEIIETIASQITPSTRVFFFSHVTSPTGLVLPAARLCRLAEERGLLSVVDGAHAPGMIELNLKEINADFYGGNCHKWMMAPTGAGFLHLKHEYKRLLKPLVTSWGYEMPEDESRWDDDCGWGGSYWARRLEFQGTQDRAAQMVLDEVLNFRTQIGHEAMMARAKALAERVRRIAAELGHRVVTPANPDLHGSLTAIAVPSLDVLAARDWIWNVHRIEAPFTRVGQMCCLRLSTAWFNTDQEIDRAMAALSELPVDELQPLRK